jgi:hypothetical protein
MTFPALAVGLTAVSLGFGAPAAQAAGAANMKSPLFAGYAAAPAASGATTASDTFKVPTVSGCTATTSAASSGAAISSTLKKLWGAGVVLGCKGGKAGYEGTGTIASVTTNLLAVSPGDTITVTASLTASKGSITFADTTKKFSKTLSGAGGTAMYALDGMGAVPTKVGSTTNLPIPNFGKVTFTGAKLNGKTPATGGVGVDMVVGTTVKIVTSALGTGGNTWTETWKHA